MALPFPGTDPLQRRKQKQVASPLKKPKIQYFNTYNDGLKKLNPPHFTKKLLMTFPSETLAHTPLIKS